MTEYGSMKMSQALAVTASDAPDSDALLTMFPWSTPADSEARAIRKVHPASLPTLPRPTPRQWKSGRRDSPVRLQNSSRMSACTAMPRVAVPPSIAIISGVQSAEFRETGEKAHPRIRNPMMETMLLTTGAQVKGPKIRRAFRASPSRAYRP